MLKLAILGYGVEGKSVEQYFKTHPYENIAPSDIEIKVFNDFKDDDIDSLGLENYDVVFRSPSVRPHYDFRKFDSKNSNLTNENDYKANFKKPYWTSATKYFFEHCPCEIIAVSGTKGKGTTCSIITALINSINKQAYGDKAPKTFLVGNIGIPPLDVLDQITEHDNVVFEMSSFQLWDLHQGSFIGVLLRIEPDHLNVHKDFEEYTYAKSAISRYKTENDFLVYFKNNKTTKSLADQSVATKLAYPIDNTSLTKENSSLLNELLDSLHIPGEHNRENAEAALLAVAARFFGGDLNRMLSSELYSALKSAFSNFQGLPHRCEFLRELNHVKYYDDNYSSALPALDVAMQAFENYPTVLIAGGFSKGTDAAVKTRIFSAKNLHKAILIGSTAQILANGEDSSRYEFAASLEDAVKKARAAAEAVGTATKPAIVLMSPGFASFDMFKNFTDRGEQFTKLVKELK
ncbi:UDP-N-acetylmuramoyl-L-alanine--D-glutamate ligase [Candidatus Saccharibacteria bacterium]|nr:UDP-N-acetylmuramoyl-L-alanine--D-glutamate ligase [Candidatus Saccharibacteria bacterium]